jgi:hypothetical protein
MNWHGHLWTMGTRALHIVRPPRQPPAVPWRLQIEDPDIGALELSGILHDVDAADTVLLVVHGMGGDATSPYCALAARAAVERGWSCLRVSLRGADGQGQDLYHAGQFSDLTAACQSAALARYRRICVLGYSLGGHAVLWLATRPGDARISAVVAICPPLDLDATADHIDGPGLTIYRRHLLAGLLRGYREVAKRREMARPLAEVAAASGIRRWDELAIVPRFGFSDVDDYYRRASVGPQLAHLQVATLIISARHDPMVTEASVEPSLSAVCPLLSRQLVERGGHVGFPSRLDLGWGAALGVESQALEWLDRQALAAL